MSEKTDRQRTGLGDMGVQLFMDKYHDPLLSVGIVTVNVNATGERMLSYDIMVGVPGLQPVPLNVKASSSFEQSGNRWPTTFHLNEDQLSLYRAWPDGCFLAGCWPDHDDLVVVTHTKLLTDDDLLGLDRGRPRTLAEGADPFPSYTDHPFWGINADRCSNDVVGYFAEALL